MPKIIIWDKKITLGGNRSKGKGREKELKKVGEEDENGERGGTTEEGGKIRIRVSGHVSSLYWLIEIMGQ